MDTRMKLPIINNFRHFLMRLTFIICLLTSVNGQGPIIQVNAIFHSKAFLPCDMSSLAGADTATLVLWYKETEENPIYSFDNRGRLSENGSHWKDNVVFGDRAFFHSKYPSGLSLETVRDTDEGYYRCRVDFDRSPTKNQKLYLNVIIPPGEPSIYDENGNNLTEGLTRSYEEGATMALKCVSRGGRPKPQLQWWHEGMLLDSKPITTSSFEDIETTSSSITVENINRSYYRNSYSCRAINNNVTAPASRMVFVNMFLAPLNVSIANTTQQLSAGLKYRIYCLSIGSVPAAKISWWKDDEPISHLSEISNSIYEQNNKNSSSSVLVFTPTKKDHNSTIKCVATNPNVKIWRIEASWILDVIYPPDVTLMLGPELNPEDIREDSDVYFHCKIDSNPPVYKTIWKHNGISIHQNLKNEIRVNDKSLILRRVKRESIGNYSCEAFNVEGEKESNPVELRISYKPVCKPNQKVIYGAARNEIIQVVCAVDSNPEPDNFKWSFNHSQEPLPEKRFNIVDKRRGMSVLTFTPRSEMDFGYLSCLASNIVGKQSLPCQYQIIPAATPNSPHNCTIGNVTTVSLEVYCRAGFDGGLTQTFELHVINFTTDNVILNQSSYEPYFRISRLTPGNNVKVRVYATNAKGYSLPFELEGTTLKAEKHIGLPGTLEITPVLGIIIGICGFLLLLILFVVCVAKRNFPYLSKLSRRPRSLCIKEKTHTTLLGNRARDEKDPDLIPFKKNTGYQVLRTDANFEDTISKTTTLPASSNLRPTTFNDQDLISDDDQLNFIDCAEKIPNLPSTGKEPIAFSREENT